MTASSRNHGRAVRFIVGVSLAATLAACGAGPEASAEVSGDGGNSNGAEEQANTGSSDEANTEGDASAEGETITIEDAQGTVEVPRDPRTVVALNNRDFTTLARMGVELAAAPVALMGDGSLWPRYADVADVGNHREPNLEQVIAANPELIITGSRFGTFYDDLVRDNPGAVVIDTTPDATSEDVGADLKHFTEALGRIFEAEDEAGTIIEAYDEAVASAREAYDGQSTVMGLITSGNAIQYAAPVDGRSVGPLFPILDLVPAIEQAAEDATHGDEISVEAIADADPDWIIVLDRDGATSAAQDGYQPAQEIIGESEALQNVTAVAEGQVIYLEPSFYLTEDIHAYTALFEQIAAAFADAS